MLNCLNRCAQRIAIGARQASVIGPTERRPEFGKPDFVQIMEVKTSRIDELEPVSKRTEQPGDALLANKGTNTADRDRPGSTWLSSSSARARGDEELKRSPNQHVRR
jgi:hypothetical protein